MEIYNPNNKHIEYFVRMDNFNHRRFLALRSYFLEGMSAQDVADKYGYTLSTVYSLARDFKKAVIEDPDKEPFFLAEQLGRKALDIDGSITLKIVALRKKYFSVPDIKSILDAHDINVSERYITSVLQKEGFGRLPRRDSVHRGESYSQIPEVISASKSERLDFLPETFNSQLAGILCFLPYIKKYGIDKAIVDSMYPGTKIVGKLSSILSFLALKLSNVRRYSVDDTWCMDRGMGLFAGLNVLPKTAWYNSYSSTITKEMNTDFLKKLYAIWKKNDLVSDTVNVDFTTIPYWGDEDPFENNWSGKRNKALASMLAILAQDPDSGIICYGDTTVRHENQDDAILEFLDFYRTGKASNIPLKYLIFDCKVTSYNNLSDLNKQEIKFITIRRRGTKLVERIESIPDDQWQRIKVKRANGKSRNVKAYEEITTINGYEGTLRQIYITGNGKIKPAIIITNDFDLPLKDIVRKYSRRWLLEKGISEQIEFFHLNRNCSGMVIKVDFDLTMSILAHNIYRIFSLDLNGYSHCEDKTIFEKFISNAAEIEITETTIEVRLKRKRNLPLLLENMNEFKGIRLSWLDQLKLIFSASTTT